MNIKNIFSLGFQKWFLFLTVIQFISMAHADRTEFMVQLRSMIYVSEDKPTIEEAALLSEKFNIDDINISTELRSKCGMFSLDGAPKIEDALSMSHDLKNQENLYIVTSILELQYYSGPSEMKIRCKDAVTLAKIYTQDNIYQAQELVALKNTYDPQFTFLDALNAISTRSKEEIRLAIQLREKYNQIIISSGEKLMFIGDAIDYVVGTKKEVPDSVRVILEDLKSGRVSQSTSGQSNINSVELEIDDVSLNELKSELNY